MNADHTASLDGFRQPDVATTSREDDDLDRAIRLAAYLRHGFYLVVLAVALAGQVSGAHESLHVPTLQAVPALSALELGEHGRAHQRRPRRRPGNAPEMGSHAASTVHRLPNPVRRHRRRSHRLQLGRVRCRPSRRGAQTT